MKNLITLSLTSLLLVLFMAGCAGKLYVENMDVNSSSVSPGDEVTSYVTLNKASDNIETVKGTVREYPEFSAEFNNDGTDGDEKAGDNVWSKKMNIPYDAPSRTFHLDITVLDKEGNVITAKNVKVENPQKSGTIDVKIE